MLARILAIYEMCVSNRVWFDFFSVSGSIKHLFYLIGIGQILYFMSAVMHAVGGGMQRQVGLLISIKKKEAHVRK